MKEPAPRRPSSISRCSLQAPGRAANTERARGTRETGCKIFLQPVERNLSGVRSCPERRSFPPPMALTANQKATLPPRVAFAFVGWSDAPMPDRKTVDAFVAQVLSNDHVGAIRDWYHED